ncbi:hypothetical protein Bca101_026376 [Brassica carinata]
MGELSYICLPEHASSFTRRDLVHEIYTKDEVNEMVTGMMGQQNWEKATMHKKIDEAISPLHNEMNWMVKRNELIQKELDTLRQESESRKKPSTSIDADLIPSIDTEVPPSTTYSKNEIDELIHFIYKDLGKAEDHFTKGLDYIYVPLNNTLSWLTTRTDQMKKAITRLQEQRTDDTGTLTSIYNHTRILIENMF